jgi:hypothetical protein
MLVWRGSVLAGVCGGGISFWDFGGVGRVRLPLLCLRCSSLPGGDGCECFVGEVGL